MELTVISGKGGTGKTTVAMGLAALSKAPVVADCDVDAPNLSLLFNGEDIENEPFFGGEKAVTDDNLCVKCGKCTDVCHFDAIESGNVDLLRCEGCGACMLACEYGAIIMEQEKSANIYVTQHSFGYIVRAEMVVGSEGSGKLVTEIRRKAYCLKSDLIIVDGSPGIGCSVIASVTGTDIVLIVTEPTQSGREDLKRLAKLCRRFGMKMLACINKYDINEDMTHDIENECHKYGIEIVGRIPYDEQVMKSVNELKPITENINSIAGKAIERLWETIKPFISANEKKEGNET